MTPSDIQDFARVLTHAFTLQNRSVEPSDIADWFSALAGYDLPAISQAISDHIRDPDAGRYPLKPADVIRRIDGGGEMKALHGWSLVERAIRLIGPWQSVVFDDPLIHVVITDLGGWVKVCETRTADLPVIRAEFVRRYTSGMARPPSIQDVPRVLPGMGSSVNAPRLIGAPETALKVWQEGAISLTSPFPTPDEVVKGGVQPLSKPLGGEISSNTHTSSSPVAIAPPGGSRADHPCRGKP